MSSDGKTKVQQQFGSKAKDYRDSFVHAKGADLQLMVDTANLFGNEKVLDIASGAGHTAFAFAPFVENCYGVDLTKEMVREATGFAKSQGIDNLEFIYGDAENLPFPDGSFEVITCRMAAHHFTSISQFVQEVSRVLKPGGKFLLVDQYVPEDPSLDAFINDLERKRDPSHVREQSLSEWHQDFRENGLVYEEVSKWDLHLEFDNWVERSKTPANMVQVLVNLLQKASPQIKETYHIRLNGYGKPTSFALKTALLLGSK
jgi:ubiquinone/menaquinone biosynthesis C-methylase UbiE